MQDEMHAKLLQKEKAENKETKRKLNTSAASKQMAMANEINDLKAKVLMSVPKVIYILSLITFFFTFLLSYLISQSIFSLQQTKDHTKTSA